MNGSEKRLATICARGGSKGVPGKNIRDLCGKPLIAHTIEQAQKSKLFDAVAVSSDSEDILNIAERYGAERIMRPPELASDTAGKLDAITHALTYMQAARNTTYSTLVDLDATSPLRIIADIHQCVSLLETNNASAVITAAPSHRSPYFNMVKLDKNDRVTLCIEKEQALLRRQDAPKTYDMNASIYVWNAPRFLKDPRLFYDDTMLHVMPKERSWDIDEPLDLTIVEMLMRENAGNA